MPTVLTEITSLTEEDCFYIIERHKEEFTFPLHQHHEFELNFIQNAKGVRRVVGDSVEEIGDVDLVLITGPNLEHVWEQGTCTSKDVREITIQFSPHLLDESLLNKKQFHSIQKMFSRAINGLAFPLAAIMNVYALLDDIVNNRDHFQQFTQCLNLLYILSKYDARELASSSFAKRSTSGENVRIERVKTYISENYLKEISLRELAEIAGMSTSSFSRFFRSITGKTISDYISTIRLGHATRALVDSNMNVSDVCYACGFSNLSNFNRVFKLKKGVSPREFRELYKKKKVLV